MENKVCVVDSCIEEEVNLIQQGSTTDFVNIGRVSLIKQTTPNTQSRILAEIFQSNPNVPLKKRDIEKRFTISEMFKHLSYPIILNSEQEAIELLNNAPGDLQRTLRSFYDKYKKYGIHKQGKGDNIVYRYIPKEESMFEIKDNAASRNIFKNKKDRDIFIASKNNKCQLCDNIAERMAIDHWRAHSIYNIDDPKIAVLLCEKCNNTHHNFDASHCIKKNMDLTYVKKWVKIEKEIRDYGYMPNVEDMEEQKTNIKIVIDHHKTIGVPIGETFWEGIYVYE